MTASLNTIISGTVLVLASATAFGALAQTPTTPATPTAPAQGARTPGKGLMALDTNNDKMLPRDEVKSRPMLTKNFDAIDSNKDSQLSRGEMKAYRKAHKGEGQKPA